MGVTKLNIGLSAWCLYCASSLAAPPTSHPSGQDTKVLQLINQLGSAKFAERETATLQLLKIGLPAMPMVQDATQHSDAEIKQRCRFVLKRFVQLDRNRMLFEFSSLSKGVDAQIPGWKSFQNLCGDSTKTRQFYANMLHLEWPTIEAGMSENGHGIDKFIDSLTHRIETQLDRRKSCNEAVLAALLFVSGHERIYLRNPIRILGICSRFESREIFQGSPHQETLRKLMGQLVGRDLDDVSISSQIYLSLYYNLTEGLDLARRIMSDRTQRGYVRQNAILLAAKLGSKEDINRLEDLLDDETVSIRQQNIQIRDVALAAVTYLSGEDPKDYGFENIRYESVGVFQTFSLEFQDSRDRDAAIRKWRERSAILAEK